MKWNRLRRPIAAAFVTAVGIAPLCFSQQPQGAAGDTPAAQTARNDAPAVGNLQEHPLKRAIDLAKAALEQSRQIRGCTYVMVKREVVDGKLTPHEAVLMKVRSQPFSVYAHTLGPVQPKGREAIFVSGQNNNKAFVHVTGFQHKLLGTMSLDPNGAEMMEGNRYPMTNAGFENMMKSILGMYEGEARHPENDVQIYTGAKVDGRSCTCVQNTHSVQRPDFPFQMTRVFYDDQIGLPIRWEAYAWPTRPGQAPTLLEEYTYRNVQVNQLTDRDFDVNNDAYGFK